MDQNKRALVELFLIAEKDGRLATEIAQKFPVENLQYEYLLDSLRSSNSYTRDIAATLLHKIPGDRFDIGVLMKYTHVEKPRDLEIKEIVKQLLIRIPHENINRKTMYLGHPPDLFGDPFFDLFRDMHFKYADDYKYLITYSRRGDRDFTIGTLAEILALRIPVNKLKFEVLADFIKYDFNVAGDLIILHFPEKADFNILLSCLQSLHYDTRRTAKMLLMRRYTEILELKMLVEFSNDIGEVSNLAVKIIESKVGTTSTNTQDFFKKYFD